MSAANNNDVKRDQRKKDIAIIGLSGRFSQSADLLALWNNLIKGKELTYLPSVEESRKAGVSEVLLGNKNYIISKSFIENPGSFDYSFFGYSKDEAELMNPQTRLMHEQVWLALEDAGCNPFEYEGKIGLFLAASDDLNWRAHAMINPNIQVGEFMSTRLANKSFMSTLVSYNLDLKGPSYYIDTACSSSLASIHIACRNLLLKECSLALAGAACIITNNENEIGYLYEEGMVFSKDGHCRAFDKDSSGTFFGEGVAVIALKRLEDAIQDKDHIYAVIKGTAVNNDGNRKVGYTAPSVQGQAECIKLAHRIAGVEPESISYIEAHGTGTKLGDPIEIEALNKAFNYNTHHRCAIGSVKSNLGHLDTVAGIAGVIKTALALKNRLLPPSINFSSPNPEINFSAGPFYVNDQLQKWERKNNELLRAGVSSFGIGGTNAHAVLEEEPVPEVLVQNDRYQLLLFSAKTKTALANYQDKFRGFIAEQEQPQLVNLAYTLQTARKHFEYRNFIVCRNKDQALEELSRLLEKPAAERKQNGTKHTVFMFSGGGSQYYKMARQLYLDEPFFKEIMDYGFGVLMRKTGRDFQEILGYREGTDAGEDLINTIEYMLPALFLVEYATARLLMNIGIQPAYMIGHSLGEYVAACISGVFSFEDAIHMVITRGSLTGRLPEGGMVGVELSAQDVQPYLNNELSIATINMDNSCVISGARAAIDNFIRVLEQNDIDYTALKISIAAHSHMLDDILEEYSKAIQVVNFSPPKIPFISNLSGKEVTAEEATSTGYWVKHLRNTVNFLNGISCLLEKGNGNYIEIGSGGTLTSFLKQNRLFQKNSFGINILRHPKEESDDHEYFMQSLGKLWQNGVSVDWKAFNRYQHCTKASVPGYCFDKTSLKVKVDPFKQMVDMGLIFNPGEGSLHSSFYHESWKRSVPVTGGGLSATPSCFLFFSDESEMCGRFKGWLKQENKVIEVRKGDEYNEHDSLFIINPFNQAHYEQLFKSLEDKGVETDQVIYCWRFEQDENVLRSSVPVMYLCQNLIINQVTRLKKISFIAVHSANVFGNEQVDIAQALVKKTLAMIIKNNSTIFPGFIDLDTTDFPAEFDKNILNDILYNVSVSNSAYRNNQRWIGAYEPVAVQFPGESNILKKQKNYLLINGFEGAGLTLVQHLYKEYDAQLFITGNEALEEGNAVFEQYNRLDKLHSKLHYHQLDCGVQGQLQHLLAEIGNGYGAISGVLYFNEENRLSDLSDLNNLIGLQTRKILHVQNLYACFKNKEPDFVWFPLKLTSLIDGINENIYADTYISLFLEEHKAELPNWSAIYLDDLHKDAGDPEKMARVFEISVNQQLTTAAVSFKDINKLEHAKKSKENKDNNASELLMQHEAINDNYVAPETALEQELCELWQSFLGYDKLGVEDSFFDLGGNSLKAMTLLKRVQKLHNVQVSLKDFFAKPTVKLFSQEISIARLIKKQANRKEANTIKI